MAWASCSLSGNLSSGCGEEHFPFRGNEAIAQQYGDDGSGEEQSADDSVDDCKGDHHGHGLRIIGGGDARPVAPNAKQNLDADDGVKSYAHARRFL